MKSATPRTSALLAWTLWVLLALLPLRGVANGLMHMPAGAQAGAGETAAPCHGEQAADHAAAQAEGCTLCDLCHGAALAGFVRRLGADLARPTWAAAQATAPPAGLQSPFFRPPRA